MLSVFYFDNYDATDGRGGAMLGLLADSIEAGGGEFHRSQCPCPALVYECPSWNMSDSHLGFPTVYLLTVLVLRISSFSSLQDYYFFCFKDFFFFDVDHF